MFRSLRWRTRRKIYQPLDPRKQQIRLLVLLPGVGTDAVHCECQVVSLKDQPSYTTISYCWGTGSSGTKITIQGVAFKASENVHDILVALRETKVAKALWIDAICINQDDPKEKAHQVALMGAVYSSSIQTIIWLGLASDGSDMGMELVENVSSGDFEIQSMNMKVAEWKALYAIMRRPWWSRLWTIQEVCLSKKAIIRCGGKEVDLSKFRELYKLHNQANRDTRKHLSPIFRSLFASVSFGYVLALWDTMVPEALRAEVGMEFWLTILPFAQYTLGRDKLFALYNLSSLEDRRSIRIDYERPDRDVFKEAAAHLIKKCGIAALQTGNVNKSWNFGLPSWAPDWSFQDPPVSMWFLSDVRLFKAWEANASWNDSAYRIGS